MSTHPCTEEMFLRDVKDHTLKIYSDHGVSRRIIFQEGDSFNCKFELITWPGSLCITGDCGTYVFSRTQDMFGFFRGPSTKYINPGYWGEKLLSIDRHGGYEEFDLDAFRERVTDHFNQHWESEDNDEGKDECWERVDEEVLRPACDGEGFAYSAVQDFDHEGFYFQDFLDGGGTDKYTLHYIWCLRAIVWGINQYDKYKDSLNKAA